MCRGRPPFNNFGWLTGQTKGSHPFLGVLYFVKCPCNLFAQRSVFTVIDCSKNTYNIARGVQSGRHVSKGADSANNCADPKGKAVGKSRIGTELRFGVAAFGTQTRLNGYFLETPHVVFKRSQQETTHFAACPTPKWARTQALKA